MFGKEQFSRRIWLKGVGGAMAVTAIPGIRGTSAAPAADNGSTAVAAALQAEPQPIDELVIVRGADLATLHPNRTTDPDSQNVARCIFEALIYAADDMSPAPELAERWEQVDPQSYRFFLRTGVTFHDGQPFTADDVIFTFDQVNNTPEGTTPFVVQSYSSIVSEVIKENDHQVLINLAEPFPIALYNLSRVNIVPRHIAADQLGEQPIGTGAYRLAEWTKGSHVALEANDAHWSGEPLSRKVTWKTVPEEAGRVAELLAGQAHLSAKISPLMVGQIEGNDEYLVKSTQDAYILHMDFNTYKPSMQDPRVRQAIYQAIDRQALVDGVAKGLGTVVNGPIIPEAFGYDPNFVDYPFDPEAAKALLAEAGFADGLDIRIATPQGRYTRAQEVSEAVVQHLGVVGIRAQVVLEEWTVHLQRAKDRDTDELFVIGWSNAPFDYLQWYYHIPRTHQYSLSQSDELETLISQAGTVVETEKRLALAQQLYAAWKAYIPTVPLYQQTAYYGLRSNVAFEPRPDEGIFPQRIGEV